MFYSVSEIAVRAGRRLPITGKLSMPNRSSAGKEVMAATLLRGTPESFVVIPAERPPVARSASYGGYESAVARSAKAQARAGIRNYSRLRQGRINRGYGLRVRAFGAPRNDA
jgi:hypothetical protein